MRPLRASPDKPVNVLFTSGGRRVELLEAFRSAYESLGLAGRLVAADIDPLAPCLQVADSGYIVPGVHEPGYIPAVVKICQEEHIDLVFPLIDPDVPVLARGRQVIEAEGSRLVALEQAQADLAFDKWSSTTFFRDLGLAYPKTWLPGSLPADGPTPSFVKPRFGSAGKDSFRAEDRAALQSLLAYVPDPVVQEFVDGPEITNDVTCSLQGEVWAVVSRRRIEVRWGEVAKGVTEDHPEIRAQCVQIARALRAVGPVTIQCILSARGPVFTDINPRFGGGIPLGIAAGVPSPAWYLMEAAGRPVHPPPLGSYTTGLYLTRYDSSYFLSSADVDRIARRRV